jgi:hypothetical protein
VLAYPRFINDYGITIDVDKKPSDDEANSHQKSTGSNRRMTYRMKAYPTGYTTLSCTSPSPSTDRLAVSPGFTNLVATMLPVMTVMPCVRLLPR